MKKLLTIIIPAILVLVFCIPFVLTATDTNCYTFETGVPFFANKNECKSASSLQDALNSLIQKLFPIAGILAFVMIIYAGFEYATSGGNTNKQKDAQDRIANAIIGLILLFAFWIIIYTINPDILKRQNISLPKIDIVQKYEQESPEIEDLKKEIVSLAGLVPLSNELQKLQQQGKTIYLNYILATKLSNAFRQTPTIHQWVVTDACIEGKDGSKMGIPCNTIYNARNSNDCHYYGLCVDIDLKNSDEYQDLQSLKFDVIALLNKNGLAVLFEQDPSHLHVTLPDTKDFFGGYPGQDICLDLSSKITGNEACWYYQWYYQK